MKDDFIISLFIGLLILLFFWFLTLLFIYVRKPPNSKLTFKLVVKSSILFFIGFIVLVVLRLSDSI